MAKKKTVAIVERAIRTIEIAGQEGLFGDYGALAAVAAGGIRVYLRGKSRKEVAAASRAVARAMAPRPRKRRKVNRDALTGEFASTKSAKKRPARHVTETV